MRSDPFIDRNQLIVPYFFQNMEMNMKNFRHNIQKMSIHLNVSHIKLRLNINVGLIIFFFSIFYLENVLRMSNRFVFLF